MKFKPEVLEQMREGNHHPSIPLFLESWHLNWNLIERCKEDHQSYLQDAPQPGLRELDLLICHQWGISSIAVTCDTVGCLVAKYSCAMCPSLNESKALEKEVLNASVSCLFPGKLPISQLSKSVAEHKLLKWAWSQILPLLIPSITVLHFLSQFPSLLSSPKMEIFSLSAVGNQRIFRKKSGVKGTSGDWWRKF